MAAVAEAEKLRQQGIDVVDCTAGEPHFATPQHIKEAAIAAIQQNFTRYTPVAGIPELRAAIVKRHAVDFGERMADQGQGVAADDLPRRFAKALVSEAILSAYIVRSRSARSR